MAEDRGRWESRRLVLLTISLSAFVWLISGFWRQPTAARDGPFFILNVIIPALFPFFNQVFSARDAENNRRRRADVTERATGLLVDNLGLREFSDADGELFQHLLAPRLQSLLADLVAEENGIRKRNILFLIARYGSSADLNTALASWSHWPDRLPRLTPGTLDRLRRAAWSSESDAVAGALRWIAVHCQMDDGGNPDTLLEVLEGCGGGERRARCVRQLWHLAAGPGQTARRAILTAFADPRFDTFQPPTEVLLAHLQHALDRVRDSVETEALLSLVERIRVPGLVAILENASQRTLIPSLEWKHGLIGISLGRLVPRALSAEYRQSEVQAA